jgi:hypothetical protein
MHVDVSDPFAKQAVPLDELHRFVVGRDHGPRKIVEQFKERLAIFQAAACDLPHDEGMHHHGCTLKQGDKPKIATAQVIHPHRRIHEDQAARSARLRGAAWSSGCVPPKRASRLALSRSIKAFKLSLKMAVRSIGPINLLALASNSSSMLSVVRMLLLLGLSIKYNII